MNAHTVFDATRQMVLTSLLALAMSACGEAVATVEGLEAADESAQGALLAADGSVYAQRVALGAVLKTTANLNLRTTASTAGAIRLVMPKDAQVQTVSEDNGSGWLQVRYNGTTGYASGKYLQIVSLPVAVDARRQAMIDRAKSGVGFGYWWGHGRWIPNGVTSQNKGVCTGSCPNCTYNGTYGADCSGFVAKIWQVPASNTNLTADSHPYSTADFNGANSQWMDADKNAMAPGDAYVYRSGGAGHIALFESKDSWGASWVYEARGCAYGIVHNARSFDNYKAIARR